MNEFKFKNNDTVYSSDFYYDLFNGGYISPDEMLQSDAQALLVKNAMMVVQEFLDQAETAGKLEGI